MKHQIRQVAEGWFRVENMLYGFWAMFWVLNGLDKFFNGESQVHPDFGKYVQGWFGVNRDDKMIHYFARLDLPDWLALGSLYSVAVLEVVIGLLFVYVMVRTDTPKIVHRAAFKLGFAVFFIFMTGDILFGDRMELWEHGTFMLLSLLTFQMYLHRGLVRQDVMGARLPVGDDGPDFPSTLEFNEFLAKATAEWAARQPPHIDPSKSKPFVPPSKGGS